MEQVSPARWFSGLTLYNSNRLQRLLSCGFSSSVRQVAYRDGDAHIRARRNCHGCRIDPAPAVHRFLNSNSALNGLSIGIVDADVYANHLEVIVRLYHNQVPCRAAVGGKVHLIHHRRIEEVRDREREEWFAGGFGGPFVERLFLWVGHHQPPVEHGLAETLLVVQLCLARLESRTVGRLLKQMNYSLKANVKRQAGSQHPDRNTQFEYIEAQKQYFLSKGWPIISMDVKTRS